MYESSMESTTSNLPIEYSSVEQFLDSNEVKEGWKRLILDNDELKASLEAVIESFVFQRKHFPARNQILRPFAYCKPEDIKVVIIGSSPMPEDEMANGLSFSSERMENNFDGRKGISIQRFHDALNHVGILRRDLYYYCGHTEWAKKGVLLLNAALTIGDGTPSDMCYHCREWRPFLAMLLKMWIKNTKLNYKMFVLLLGYAEEGGNENFAVELWREAYSLESNEHIHFRDVHHPTFPNARLAEKGVKNNFIEEAAAFLNDIGKVYPNIFKTAKIQRIKQQVSTIDKLISLTTDDADGINEWINNFNERIKNMNENLMHILRGIGKIDLIIDCFNKILISTDADTTVTREGIGNINDGIDHINKVMENISSSVASISRGITSFESAIENRHMIEIGKESIIKGIENYTGVKESLDSGINIINFGIESIHKEIIKQFRIDVEGLVNVGNNVAESIEVLSGCIDNITDENEIMETE